MQKFKLGMILVSVFCLSMADNLQLPKGVTCHGMLISMATPESAIEHNCKVFKIKNAIQVANGQDAQKVKNFSTNDGITPEDISLSKIEFFADTGSKHKCYYKDNKLVKCKLISLPPTTNK